MKKYLLVLLALVAGGVGAYAQQTGSFDAAVTFNSQPRTLSNFVPANYNAAISYRLIIGLHGMGDNSANYRNAIVNSLNFAAAFPDAILICPDGGSDQGKDFYSPAGDEAIIVEAVNYAKANYNIDASKIVLQGFSLGGRSALRYGLDHPADFEALLLSTPAIQGVKEGDNGSPVVKYDFSKANQLPIYITLGDADPIYEEPINVTIRNLVKNKGKVAYKKFVGGHTIPDFRTYPYLDFFAQPYNNGSDASIYEIQAPVRSCDGNIQGNVLLQNTGNDTLKAVKIAYGIGTKKDTLVWQGNLGTHEYAQVTLPAFQSATLPVASHDFEVDIIEANAGVQDTLTDFNAAVKPVHIMTSKLALPYECRFTTQADVDKWAFNNSGDYILPFEYTATDGAVFSFNSIFIFDNSTTKEEIISPNLDFSGQTKAYLHFKTDYNYVKYTAAVFGVDTVFADTLEVLVSTDCGNNYSSIFKKGGADLTGQSAPLLNPLNLNQVALDVDPGRYKQFNVDVSSYAGQSNVNFKFRYISALGGYIYLDDVIVNNDAASVEKPGMVNKEMKLYPNPATHQLNISFTEAMKQVQVFNVMGQLVYSEEGNAALNKTINVANLPKGTYWIKIFTEQGQLQDKFIVE